MAAIRAQAQSPTLAGAVSLPGCVRHELVAKYCQASDFFVFPSHSEGMPNALLEAMACGLPCVATRVGGMPEALEHGVSGLLVPPQSSGDLTKAMQQLISDPGMAQALGASACRTIAKHFSWQANAKAHQAVYEAVAGKSMA
jgi:glycosyltransferase involved in cell wall biosynthesis